MPTHLKALVVILLVAVTVFVLAEKPLTAGIMQVADYRRRRNIWFAVTLIGFLSHNFWLYAVLTVALLVLMSGRERNPLALYFLLLFAIPSFSMDVPGFGLVNTFVSLSHVRLLNLAILLPLAVVVAGERQAGSVGRHRAADVLVLLYLGYVFVTQAMVDNITGMMRNVFYAGVDVWLPYYVASRALRDLRAWHEALAAFVVAVAVMALLAPLEVAKGWLLYDNLRSALGVPSSPFPTYQFRGDDGALRANVAVDHSIVLGYVMMIALILFSAIAPLLRPRSYAVLAVAALVSGLVAALSRGPWVGATAGLLVALSFGAGAGKRIAWIIVGSLTGVVLLAFAPGGDRVVDQVVDHLPFIGTVDESSVTYRQLLFEVSMGVFWQSPVFGSLYYMLNPAMEEMRQGQGIIDMVNSYLAVALPYGAVGLFLFVSPFAYSLWACWRARARHAATGIDIDRLGRALLGAMVAVLVTIATVSSISVVAPLYWLLAGLCVGYARMFSARRLGPADGASSQRLMRRSAST